MTTPTQGEHAQTEALRLAEEFERDGWIAGTKQWCAEASAELRRLHAQVAALTAGNHEELAHELFAAAQLAPGEGIEDAVSRIAAALTAAPQGVAYAELPNTYYIAGGEIRAWDEHHMRDFADRTHALRASNGQAPAGATDEMAINRPVEDSALPFNQWRGEMQSALKRAGVYAARSPGAGNKLTLRWRATRDDVLPTTTAQAAPAAGAVAKPSMDAILAAARNWGDVETYLCRSGSGEKKHRIVFHVHERAAHFAKELLAAAPTPAAQADSGLEDAARYRHLRDCNSGSLAVMQITGTGEDDWCILTEDDADAAIDAARKQGGTHDNH